MSRRDRLKIHRYLAAVVLLPLLVVLGSGAALSFAREFDRALHPQLLSVAATQQIDLQIVHAALLQQIDITPDSPIGAIQYPRSAYDPVQLQMGEASVQTTRYLNPHNGKLLGVRAIQDDWYHQLSYFHAGLWRIETGSLVTLFSSCALLGLLLLGLTLLRQSHRWQVVGWHAWLGLCITPILLCMLITGLVAAFTSTSFKQGSEQTAQQIEGQHWSIAIAAHGHTFAGLCQGLPTALLSRPSGAELQLSCDNGSQWIIGPDRVTSIEADAGSVRSGWWGWHSGEWAGLPGRAIWMWSVLAVFYLFYSGLRDWWNKTRLKQSGE